MSRLPKWMGSRSFIDRVEISVVPAWGLSTKEPKATMQRRNPTMFILRNVVFPTRTRAWTVTCGARKLRLRGLKMFCRTVKHVEAFSSPHASFSEFY